MQIPGFSIGKRERGVELRKFGGIEAGLEAGVGADLAAKVAFYGIVVCWWAFVLTFWLRKRPAVEVRAVQRDRASYLGLFLQALGYFLVWMRPLQHRQPLLMADGAAWLEWTIAMLSLGLAAASVGLVIWAARCLGKQWSLGAQVVKDHELVRSGPYRLVRNPIYTGMYGLLVATGLAGAHWLALAAAVIVFGIGTWIRIRSEERLLRAAFGPQFDQYAREVPALIPGIY
jgi:protein-S-isoprenylcysteine O-methyltransferase Ste14